MSERFEDILDPTALARAWRLQSRLAMNDLLVSDVDRRRMYEEVGIVEAHDVESMRDAGIPPELVRPTCDALGATPYELTLFARAGGTFRDLSMFRVAGFTKCDDMIGFVRAGLTGPDLSGFTHRPSARRPTLEEMQLLIERHGTLVVGYNYQRYCDRFPGPPTDAVCDELFAELGLVYGAVRLRTGAAHYRLFGLEIVWDDPDLLSRETESVQRGGPSRALEVTNAWRGSTTELTPLKRLLPTPLKEAVDTARIFLTASLWRQARRDLGLCD